MKLFKSRFRASLVAQSTLWKGIQMKHARRRVILIVGVVGLQLALGVQGWAAAQSAAHPLAPHVKADFNGDGYEDLAIGVRAESVGAASPDQPIPRQGAVHVIYGSSSGLVATRSQPSQLWHQDSPGVVGTAEDAEAFGAALAAGDFNNDGFSDLAIGVPGDRESGPLDPLGRGPGAVNVLYGSALGLTAWGNQLWHQASFGILGTAQVFDKFGDALAVGDFNKDGFFDLAIGVPEDNVGSADAAGAVHVLYGSASGLTASGNQLWHADSPGIQGSSATSGWFGLALAAGDFNHDGFFDLAIGAPATSIESIDAAGAVHVLYGSAAGLTAQGNQQWHQNSPGIQGAAETLDNFGSALAVGDFDKDGFSDLAIGVPHKSIGSVFRAGALHVLYGSASGLTAQGNQLWDQDSPGIPSIPETNDSFASVLTAGDFDNDGFFDLAIGVPGESTSTVQAAGLVHVLYGSQSGLTSLGNQVWHQDSPGISSSRETNDHFGSALAAGDFNNDGFSDLAIGVPGEAIGSIAGAGVVHVLYGSVSGLTAQGNQLWDQDSPGILESPEFGDAFGGALAAFDEVNHTSPSMEILVSFYSRPILSQNVSSASRTARLRLSILARGDLSMGFWTIEIENTRRPIALATSACLRPREPCRRPRTPRWQWRRS